MVPSPDIGLRPFAAWLCVILLLAAALRVSFPTADPPWNAPVGITWHDEGPWVHNARNRVLWHEWSTDRWNPMYLAPVFTALVWASFESFGVGMAQARIVSVVMGLLSIVFVAVGVAACSNRRAALVAAALLASNHAWVQWNRVALLEAPMVAFIAISWGAYALAERRPWWGGVAGVAAVLAFFSKAAAAFYVAALGLEAVFTLARGSRVRAEQPGPGVEPFEEHSMRRRQASAALWTLGGLAVASGVLVAGFVLPNWSEYHFYNWQMSVTRKPSYGLGVFVDRASWVPVVNDFFTRMWPVTVLALAACLALLGRWRTARPSERLLGLWVALGLAELVVHDAGNERRLVLFVPVLIVLAALMLAGGSPAVSAATARLPRRRALVAVPIVLYASYIASAAILRVAFVPDVRPSVWAGSAVAVIVTSILYAAWPRLVAGLSRFMFPRGLALAIVGTLMAADLAQFWHWAATRTYKNVEASRAVGRWLPPGTLVHGKLANGLALENRIRPVFVGRGFGNYDDRATRDDVRYVLTYVDPRIGYEGSVIADVLAAHPGWRILGLFDVAETASGHDRAALIEKPARRPPAAPPGSSLAQD